MRVDHPPSQPGRYWQLQQVLLLISLIMNAGFIAYYVRNHLSDQHKRYMAAEAFVHHLEAAHIWIDEGLQAAETGRPRGAPKSLLAAARSLDIAANEVSFYATNEHDALRFRTLDSAMEMYVGIVRDSVRSIDQHEYLTKEEVKRLAFVQHDLAILQQQYALSILVDHPEQLKERTDLVCQALQTPYPRDYMCRF